MPAGASSIVALTVPEHADIPTAALAYHALASGSAALTFWWNTTADDEAMKVVAAKTLSRGYATDS